MIIAVVVTAASATDNAIGIKLLGKVAAHTPTVTHAWVDVKQDIACTTRSWASTSRASKRCDTLPGFVPVKKR